MKEIYLDNAASTPIDPRVGSAMRPYFGSIYGNPSALHRFGQKASRAVFESRRTIAGVLGANYEDIIFTGSATEANNLAIAGTWKGLRNLKLAKPRIITFAIEHDSVLEVCRSLEDEGVETIFIKPDKNGFFDLKKFEQALNNQTFLVSVMHANNEMGVIQPIEKISEIIRHFRESRIKNQELRAADFMIPFLHTDAAQSFQYLDCNVKKLGVDLLTLSAHKIYGPKGIGALYVGKDLQKIMKPIIAGAGQEGGLRSGTENVPSIAGFAKAAELAIEARERESKRVLALRNRFWKKLVAGLKPKKIFLNGSAKNRLPNNLNIYFPGNNAHELLIKLDMAGIAASPGAACSARVSKESYVLREMGFSASRASESLRFSLGRRTTALDVDAAVSVIIKLLR